MNLIFEMEHVICSPNADYGLCKPIANVTEFMQWLRKSGHHITIWTKRSNEMETKMKTENWLKIQQIPYDRLLFDRPKNPIFVDETPPNAKYHRNIGDNGIVEMLFEEWKEWNKETQKE